MALLQFCLLKLGCLLQKSDLNIISVFFPSDSEHFSHSLTAFNNLQYVL